MPPAIGREGGNISSSWLPPGRASAKGGGGKRERERKRERIGHHGQGRGDSSRAQTSTAHYIYLSLPAWGVIVASFRGVGFHGLDATERKKERNNHNIQQGWSLGTGWYKYMHQRFAQLLHLMFRTFALGQETGLRLFVDPYAWPESVFLASSRPAPARHPSIRGSSAEPTCRRRLGMRGLPVRASEREVE